MPFENNMASKDFITIYVFNKSSSVFNLNKYARATNGIRNFDYSFVIALIQSFR